MGEGRVSDGPEQVKHTSPKINGKAEDLNKKPGSKINFLGQFTSKARLATTVQALECTSGMDVDVVAVCNLCFYHTRIILSIRVRSRSLREMHHEN